MRVALVLSGLPRDFEAASNSMYSRIINRFSIDPGNIFISVWNERGYWYPGDALHAKSFAEAGRVSLEEIRGTYPGAQVDLEEFDQVSPHLQSLLEPFPEVTIPSLQHSNFLVRGINLVSMLYKINRALEMAFADPKITHIVRTRPDLVLKRRLRGFSDSHMVVAKQSNHLGSGIGDNLHLGRLEFHRPVMNALQNLESLFLRSNGILCPHLIMQKAFESSGVRFKQKIVQFQTLHTPGGMYQALAPDGTWAEASTVAYPRSNQVFKGKRLE